MALTRKLLKGMNLTEEQIETVVEAHAETVDALKSDLQKYKADADKLTSVQKELDDLKKDRDGGYKEKYEKVKKEFDDYKSDVNAKETQAAKEKAVREYYESKNITGKSLDIAMRGSAAEISAIELEDGKIKDTSAIDGLVNGMFSGLVTKTTVTGAQTSAPPANNGGKSAKSKDEILKMTDAVARQRAIAENMQEFGINKD